MNKISIKCRTLKKMSWTLWLNPVALSPAVPIRRKERSRKKRTGVVFGRGAEKKDVEVRIFWVQVLPTFFSC